MPAQQPPAPPRKVVVLGGGPAGVATAFWLTAPEQNGAFAVTLYTQGWRLGGKCASGRNADQANRIEEHGLHMLMGCYENAFATLRTCFAEWSRGPNNPFKTWQDAFLPLRQVSVMEQDGPGTPATWSPWNIPDPLQLPGEPGDGLLPPVSADRLVSLDVSPAPAAPRTHDPVLRMVAYLDAHVRVPDPLDGDYKAALAALRTAIGSPGAATPTNAMARVDAVNGRLRAAQLDRARRRKPARRAATAMVVEDVDLSPPWDRALALANLGLAIGAGYLRDIAFGGADAYDKLNTQDFRQWLTGCGASAATLAAAPVRAIYDLTFAFPNGAAGSIDNGSIAAGVTLRFVLALAFGYRDAPIWKMAAGMGDTVFTPLYQTLQARGVACQFFHRVTNLQPAQDGTIGTVTLSRQAAIVGGQAYAPLVPVQNLDCWPNQPDWTQLVNGAALQQQGADFESSFCDISVGDVTLTAGADFDIVVLAMPPEALKRVAAPLTQASAAWQTALDASRSVATQALQLWMAPSVPQLGWQTEDTVLTAFAEPYDSWADMSHLLGRESWPAASAPQSIGYFCGCMTLPATGPISPGQTEQLAVTLASNWLAANIAILWPAAAPPPWAVPGPACVSRYDNANFDLSDLYVQTPAGNNVASRFDPGQTAGFANLYVVGDWTKTRFSGGCFESAIESAMLAARAISGFPTRIQTT